MAWSGRPAQAAVVSELAQALSLVGLAVGTLSYALIVVRRERQRRTLYTTAITGLHGLVRVLAAD